MKKLLSLLCAVVLLSGCSSTSSWFGGSDCQSKLAREFAEDATTAVYFAFDSSALSAEAVSALDSQIAWLKKNSKVNVVREVPPNTTWLWVNAVPKLLNSIWFPRVFAKRELLPYLTARNMLFRAIPKKHTPRAVAV